MKRLLLPALVLATAFMLAAPVSAVTYTLSVGTDSQSYVGTSTIHVSGQVSPAPGPGTAVTLRVFNPNKVLVTADEVPVNGTTGFYSDAIVASGSSSWVGGNYVVNATWGAYGSPILSTATFVWSSSATTITTTTTSSTSSSSTTSTSTSSNTSSTSSTASTTTTSTKSSSTTSTSSSSSTTSTTASSTSSSSAGGIPEFPYQAMAATVFILLVLVSYLAVRRTMRPRNPSL